MKESRNKLNLTLCLFNLPSFKVGNDKAGIDADTWKGDIILATVVRLTGIASCMFYESPRF